jgi:hypothetical protein
MWVPGWVSSRASLNAETQGKILWPCWGSKPSHPVCSQILHWLSYPVPTEYIIKLNYLLRYYTYLFVVYFRTLLQWLRLYSIKWYSDMWMMNWKEFGKKRSWPNFNVLSLQSPAGPVKNHKNPQSGQPVSDLNPEPLKYEAGVFTTRPRCSVHNYVFS